jgi:hypothetical protein
MMGDGMRRGIAWVLIGVVALLVIGLMGYGRGHKHYRGDELGSHGTKVVILHIVP